jgi:hypothetical protein
MRRILSILLAIAFGLGPVLAAVPAEALAFGWGASHEDSRLPACCRRNGTHHCGMNTQNEASSSEHGTTAVAYGTCPYFPRSLASTMTSSIALLAAGTTQSQLLADWHTPQASAAAARISEQRTWPKRGPPAIEIL